ncbi:cupredoxin domain-containing protein [Candidatus Woesearchaeota archaeon]|nr:cupredoxin domain-containing protein [Candidatus Woesearchaeota archaeon]
MKAIYMVALLMIVLMVGCATKQQEAPAAPEAPPAMPEATPSAPGVMPTEAEEMPGVMPSGAVETEVIVTNAGFDPAELEVAAGTKISLKVVEGRHKMTIDGSTTPVIEEGSSYEVTLEEAGEIRIFDIFSKKSAYITVTG